MLKIRIRNPYDIIDAIEINAPEQPSSFWVLVGMCLIFLTLFILMNEDYKELVEKKENPLVVINEEKELYQMTDEELHAKFRELDKRHFLTVSRD